MSISAANCVPDFGNRRRIVADDLRRLEDPAVIFEHRGVDSDGAVFWVYTVAGWLDGVNVATIDGGVTIGGDVIVVAGRNREEADLLAGLGLQDTIDAIREEETKILDAHAALARLSTIGALERMDLALKPSADMSEQFVEDTSKLRQLAGDDIILTTERSGPVH